jgi:hypothetical protein
MSVMAGILDGDVIALCHMVIDEELGERNSGRNTGRSAPGLEGSSAYLAEQGTGSLERMAQVFPTGPWSCAQLWRCSQPRNRPSEYELSLYSPGGHNRWFRGNRG